MGNLDRKCLTQLRGFSRLTRKWPAPRSFKADFSWERRLIDLSQPLNWSSASEKGFWLRPSGKKSKRAWPAHSEAALGMLKVTRINYFWLHWGGARNGAQLCPYADADGFLGADNISFNCLPGLNFGARLAAT